MLKSIAFMLVLSLFSIGTQAQSIAHDSTRQATKDPLWLGKEILQFAQKHLHLRYRSGGISPRGFDCSGFVYFCFKHFALPLPHSSAAQGLLGVEIPKQAAMPGDLIFFKGHNSKSSRIGHVGIITEVTDTYVKFIHSAWNGGVRYDFLHADYYQRRFMGIRRVIGTL
ncbi:MAG: C40 family peptidase [Spirosomataceae bacterium]